MHRWSFFMFTCLHVFTSPLNTPNILIYIFPNIHVTCYSVQSHQKTTEGTIQEKLCTIPPDMIWNPISRSLPSQRWGLQRFKSMFPRVHFQSQSIAVSTLLLCRYHHRNRPLRNKIRLTGFPFNKRANRSSPFGLNNESLFDSADFFLPIPGWK